MLYVVVFPWLLPLLWFLFHRKMTNGEVGVIAFLAFIDTVLIFYLWTFVSLLMTAISDNLYFLGAFETFFDLNPLHQQYMPLALFLVVIVIQYVFNRKTSAQGAGQNMVHHFLLCVASLMFLSIVTQPALSGPIGRGFLDREKVEASNSPMRYFFAKVAHKSVDIGDPEITTFIGKMILIEPGHYSMGSPPDERGRTDDEQSHVVNISSSFYVQEEVVSYEKYSWLMKDKDRNRRSPLVYISWDDAHEFIQRLNKQEKTDKYRLPTEAEWEYVCRAGSEKPFSSGDCLEQGYGIFRGNKDDSECPAVQGSEWPYYSIESVANAWGVHGMHGNVQEWVQDWYGEYPKGEVTDPKGPATGEKKVARGGGWDSPAEDCRCAVRKAYSPDYKADNLGFRVVRDL